MLGVKRMFAGLGIVALLAGCVASSSSPVPPRETAKPQTSRSQPVPAPSPVARKKTSPVAVLLPLSGEYASLGQSLVEATQLALFEAGADDVSLTLIDTAGDSARAQKEAYRAIHDGARLFIGPVFSPELEAIQPVAKASHVPILALSNNALLANNNSFILGYTPGEQIARVIGYAQTQGVQRIAALVPRGPYGDAIADALPEAASQAGVTLAYTERFAEKADTALVAQGFVAAVQARGGADALLLPLSAPAFRALVPQLVAAGLDVSRMRFLGTAQLGSLGGASGGSSGSALDVQKLPVTGKIWFANLDPAQRTAFERRYQDAYGQKPAAIASLAYDATALAVALSRRGALSSLSRQDMMADLTSVQGYAGVDGIFRLRPGGDVERGLAVYEMTTGGATIIDPAPKTFSGK